jgi:predicted RNase H-like nuclease (RuvC/YqgF family)
MMRRIPPGHDLDEVRARVIRGQSLEQVIGDMKVQGSPPETPAAPPAPVDGKTDERVRLLDGTVKRLRAYIAELQEDLKERDYEIRRLQARIRKISTARNATLAKDTEIAKRDLIIESQKKRIRREERYNKNLLRRIARIKKFAELSMDGEVVPVKVMGSLTKDGLRSLAEDTGIEEGDVVFAGRTDGWGRSVVKDLVGMKVAAVIVGDVALSGSDSRLPMAFHDAGLPLLSISGTGAQVRGKHGLCSKEHLDAALRAWNTGHEKREREKKTELIEHIFKEYKSERGKVVKKGG